MNNRDLKTVHRAYMMVPIVTRYKLGAGGRNPNASDPRTIKDGVLGCDCSGFANYCWGKDRYVKATDEWDNTDGIISVAKQASILTKPRFMILSRPEPGCAVIYPSYKTLGIKRIGHCGIVVDVPAEWDNTVKDCWRNLKVIDCRSATPATAVRDGMTWWPSGNKKSYFVRYIGESIHGN